MGLWELKCPKGGEYQCEGHYTGGHGQPFALHCDSIKTVRAPSGGACLDAEVTGNPRKYLPHGLTECEKAHKSVRLKLSRCIKKNEPKERAGLIESAVAVCRASVKCP